MKKLFLSLLSIPLLFSCAVDEFCTYSYNAKHLIDVYYSSQNVRIETMPGTIVCLSDDFSTACYSSEFAKFLNLEQSSQMQRNFLDIAVKNNDNCEWQVSFTQMKDKQLTPDDVVCNTALDKGISKIELKSNLDFDAKHPAGTSLMDVVDMSVVVLGKELSKTSGKIGWKDHFQKGLHGLRYWYDLYPHRKGYQRKL